MSEKSEASNNENFNKKNKFEIPCDLQEQLQQIPGALEFIALLEKQIRKQKRKLKKLKPKKQRTKCKNVATQTDDDTPVLFDETAVGPKSLAEEITEAAELATQNTGFVYDESSGMYYDSNTGYYYNSEYGLYYDANTGTYMSYKQETNTYEFHSQVTLPRATHKEHKRKKKHIKDVEKAPKCAKLERETSGSVEAEEGECSNSSSNETSEDYNSDNSDITKKWPPCMRIIVEQSQLPKIKIGTLYMLTFEGGTLGREGSHAILLPDINISKSHLSFTYDQEKKMYLATDVGSRNGTILNGKRMSDSKMQSEPIEVAHGSRIQIGSLVLLCHVHEGYQTCGLCEPGLVQNNETEEKVGAIPRRTKSQMHKSELRKLRKKFGVSGFEEGGTKLASGYTDRAQKRRETVGSQNPHEKTEVASLNESISSQNKGFKMLSKMGWKEGQSLGKESQGLVEPIPIIGNSGTSGIGSTELKIAENCERNRQMIWKKAQERFQKLPVADIFQESD